MNDSLGVFLKDSPFLASFAAGFSGGTFPSSHSRQAFLIKRIYLRSINNHLLREKRALVSKPACRCRLPSFPSPWPDRKLGATGPDRASQVRP
jgi:hypothetical protein